MVMMWVLRLLFVILLRVGAGSEVDDVGVNVGGVDDVGVNVGGVDDVGVNVGGVDDVGGVKEGVVRE